jgi:signal peptidase II
LVTACALSNIFDRVYLGYVRDFWDLRLGFTFNLADAFIILGLIFLLFASNSREDSGITQKNT